MLDPAAGARTSASLPSPRSSMRPRAALTLLLTAAIVLASVAAHAQVRFEKESDGVLVHVNGKPFSALHYGKEAGKPALHPLLTISGGPDPVTRGFPLHPLPGDSTDSPHHRGLAIGAACVNGQDFWDNEPGSGAPGRGRIVFKEVIEATGGEDRGTLAILAHWIGAEGRPLLVERRRMTFHAKPETHRTLDIDFELEANEDVTFADHEGAVIGMRLALPFDTHYDGWAVNEAGGINAAGAHGRRSPWLAWIGITSGGQRMGVAMLDHPANLNHPTRWEVQEKGFFMANPFGARVFAASDPTASAETGGHTLKRGEKLRLRYRVLVYPAERESPETVGKVGALFKEFAGR